MQGFGLAMATAAAVLAAGAARAQDAAPSPATPSSVSGITVVGKKPNPTVSAASEFVRQRMPESPMTGQYPRFAVPVCAYVQGLPPKFDAFIEARILKLAAEVHAPVNKNKLTCVPNVQVIFTPYPEKMLFNIGRKREMLLGYHYRSQYQRLTTWSRPIQSYYVTRTRDTKGRSSFDVVNTAGATLDPHDAQFGGAVALGGDGPHGYAGSRLGADLSSDIAFALILGDSKKVADAKIGEVADYIAMLALAPWRNLERCNAVIPTILNLMADACLEEPPETVTPSDLSLLTALYAVNPRESGSQQRMEIAARLSKADTEPQPAAP
jgi:hypothetical protein